MAVKIGEGLRILLLDDEKDICGFFKDFLVKRGFEVETALTGPKAKATAKKFKPQIAILDIYLSKDDVNGMDVLKYIKEQQPDCCCLMVTRADDPALHEQAMAMGAHDYLVKPLTAQKIETALNKVAKRIGKGAK
jgi:DNA-binding response OmpR family regulator